MSCIEVIIWLLHRPLMMTVSMMAILVVSRGIECEGHRVGSDVVFISQHGDVFILMSSHWDWSSVRIDILNQRTVSSIIPSGRCCSRSARQVKGTPTRKLRWNDRRTRCWSRSSWRMRWRSSWRRVDDVTFLDDVHQLLLIMMTSDMIKRSRSRNQRRWRNNESIGIQGIKGVSWSRSSIINQMRCKMTWDDWSSGRRGDVVVWSTWRMIENQVGMQLMIRWVEMKRMWGQRWGHRLGRTRSYDSENAVGKIWGHFGETEGRWWRSRGRIWSIIRAIIWCIVIWFRLLLLFLNAGFSFP